MLDIIHNVQSVVEISKATIFLDYTSHLATVTPANNNFKIHAVILLEHVWQHMMSM